LSPTESIAGLETGLAFKKRPKHIPADGFNEIPNSRSLKPEISIDSSMFTEIQF